MNNFLSYHDFINESESADEGYGCIMLLADVPDWPRLVRRLVREEDVYTAPDDDYGYEENPHITLMYGIHDREIIDKSIIYSKIEDIPAMRFTVNEVSIFPGDDKPYDVVKFDIKPTKTLLDIRKGLEDDLPNTQTFTDYHPHMTIAYVKKMKGSKYRRILRKGLRFAFNRGVYSMPNYRKVYIDLKRKEYKK